MPYIVNGEPGGWRTNDYRDTNHNYDYPYGLNLHPDSDFHTQLRNKIWQRARESRNEIQKRFDSWREIDRSLTAYIPLKTVEEQLKKEDASKPVSIVFPYTYSMLEALLTYLSIAFFQDPVFRYEGFDDKDTIGAMLLEKVVQMHCVKSKTILNLHTMFRDALAYGVGNVIPEWFIRRGRKPVKKTHSIMSMLGISRSNSIDMVDSVLYEGNALSNIDPYMWLPDPSVASNEVQKGEFVGWVERDNYMNLLSEETHNPESGLFNVKYLSKCKDRRSVLALDQSDRQTRHGGNTELNRSTTSTQNPVDVINMYVTLIPKEWKLSKSEVPEKWFFRLSADNIITTCMKADHNHGMYPTATASPEFDGYSITPIGRLEVLYGLQHTLDFLFNSHIANVRKSINDMLIVDPYLVNIKDIEDPKPGKLIRLRRPAWGRGVDKVVQQLAVQDITRLNIADSSYITQMMDRISGADQSMQGALRQGGPERLTSAEFQGTRGSAFSRLQRLAIVIGAQAMQDIGLMYATHTQQYMTKDTYVKIAGDYEEELRTVYGDAKRTKVTPYDLAIDYDLIVRDGSIPGGNFSEAWIDLFKIIGPDEELRKAFDVPKLFMYIAKELGAKNVQDFKRNMGQIQPQTMPDEQVMQQVQAGNMIPVGGMQ
jgi:hypothetical protein